MQSCSMWQLSLTAEAYKASNPAAKAYKASGSGQTQEHALEPSHAADIATNLEQGHMQVGKQSPAVAALSLYDLSGIPQKTTNSRSNHRAQPIHNTECGKSCWLLLFGA